MPNVFRARARTFSFAAYFLPANLRDAVAGLYTFARAIDDLVDEPPATHAREDVRAELDEWRGWLEQPAVVAPPHAALAACVVPALTIHGVPAAYLRLLVDGVASDVNGPCLDSWSDLRVYCVQVASSVGLAMCHLLGAGDDPVARQSAVDLGIAMQLTNILRDVGADLAAGRVYLARDDLAAHGYSPERLHTLAERVAQRGPGALDEPFRDLMRTQIGRARAYYARGLDGVPRLPADSRLAILIAARLYRAILDDIEAADFDVFTRRASTSTWSKVAEAARCAFMLRLPTCWRQASSAEADSHRGDLPRGSVAPDLLPVARP